MGDDEWLGKLAAVLVMVTAFASVFSLLLGYSRIPFAAARDGNFPAVFGKLHPTRGFPYVSLLALAGMACVFCFFSLGDVIAALVVLRICLQFGLQHVGVVVLRRRIAGGCRGRFACGCIRYRRLWRWRDSPTSWSRDRTLRVS